MLGACACLAETRTKRPCLGCRELVVEGARGELHGADQQPVQQVPVLERLLVQRLPAAPAADQVDQPVDPAEALDQPVAPAPHRILVGQVDRPPVPALGASPSSLAQRLDVLLPAVGPGDGRPGLGQPLGHQRPEPTADPGDRDHPSLETLSVSHPLPILPHQPRVERAEQRKTTHLARRARRPTPGGPDDGNGPEVLGPKYAAFEVGERGFEPRRQSQRVYSPSPLTTRTLPRVVGGGF